jgi:glutamine cyclotransferase
MVIACNNSSNNGTNEDINNSNSNTLSAPELLNYTIVNVFPHDTSSYTQGKCFV